MKILHFYPEEDRDMIAAYVDTLCAHMGVGVVSDKATRVADALQLLDSHHYDVLHLHGCWRNTSLRVVRKALKGNIRLVVSPHGQLEPWVQEEHYWQEKLPKKLLYQKYIVSHAYAVVIQGKMEEKCMKKLKWNSRTVIIRNCLITRSISADEMSTQTYSLYRKILDSNTLQLMTADTKTTLRQLIKAGITGDVRWLHEACIRIEDEAQWRMLLCYAHQEQIADIVSRGLRVLQLDAPDINVADAPCFYPDGYTPTQTIESAIGMQFATENERLLATFRHLRKLVFQRRLTIAHLIELDRELRFHGAEEEQLCEALEERHLLAFAARLMQLAADLTGLEEGFMPVAPRNDRQARTMRKQVDNHLKI